ncbi:HpcH/HpaI aldolase/citrate lyase family protein [Bacillus sp. FJAT-49736]|uniref:HpcH/HpaI aldolase/citrate lyase family protein n=1 Tax=Bacillus sp. FJAT-49736 TaxID=2833582 RepID=UPI001BC93EEC|nr:HpcH/HpaI aldolase/citrate lyase family protein [Bacillus sp. FJAT-49736]MBS4172657.1 HpcH/HpaI aldolase/citrate lyase family protein [Bacillus sp. FJAT-49736]
MRHFQFLSDDQYNSIFQVSPGTWSAASPKEILAYALGGTLYMPGTRTQISNDILSGKFLNGKYAGLTSMVICLEDSISDHEVIKAEMNCVIQLQRIYQSICSQEFLESNLPLIFIRVRNPFQIQKIIDDLGSASTLLSGFVLPKFNATNGKEFLEQIYRVNKAYNLSLYALPILETQEVIYKETRMEALLSIKNLLDQYYEFILNIRIGATDFSGLFGIRRDSNTTIYDTVVIRDCISDILNVFGRGDREYIISGAVWEHFHTGIPLGESNLFQSDKKIEFPTILNNQINKAFIQELYLDKMNGIIGKTIIHPSHIQFVQAFHVVTHEEYMDALSIIENADTNNGVIPSTFHNKMNEVKPHYRWANKIILKSKVYGVLHEQQSFIHLLGLHDRVHI